MSALIIGVAILVCAGGLHRHIPHLRGRAGTASISVRGFLRQFRAALAVPSLRALLFSTVFSYVASGMTNALWVYLYSFFWGLESWQISTILVANVVGACVAYVVFPRFATGREKKRVAIGLGFVSLAVGVSPIALRLVGLFPANGTDALFGLLLLHGLIQVGLIVMSSSIFLSMTTDIAISISLIFLYRVSRSSHQAALDRAGATV